MSGVVWSPSALADLRGIRSYIAQFNPKAAEDLAMRLIEAASRLRSFPYRGRVIGDGVREWPLEHDWFKLNQSCSGKSLFDRVIHAFRPSASSDHALVHPYVVRYEILGDEVRVLGVRHGRRRPP